MNIPAELLNAYLYIFFSGSDEDIGLSDFMLLMSQPSWIWSEIYDFPRINSLNDLARKEIQNFFNYDTNLEFSENLKLKKPKFKKNSMKTVCNGQGNTNFTNYCKLVNNLPDLTTIMQLMSLAMSPTNFDNNYISNKIR